MSPNARTAATLAILALAGFAAVRVVRGMIEKEPPRRQLPVPVAPRSTALVLTGPRTGAAYSASTLREVGTPNAGTVRPAGPEAMRDAPRRPWDPTDEASDESFPASDPPATY